MILNNVVSLAGSGFDPDGDNVTFAWTLSDRPAGSTAQLSNSSSATPSFVPDKAGLYAVDLLVNDGFANSAPDTVSIISAADFSQTQIQ